MFYFVRYLAPEALQGRFTKACDVFSLGITMLELACNLDLPRHGDLWQKIRMEGPDPASTMHLQPELRRVLLMMMTSEEERRPCVRQLLELPSVRSAVRSRGRQIFIAKCGQTVTDTVSMGLALLRLLFSFLLLLINPLLDHIASKPSPSTPPPSAVAVFHAQATTDAFSDEEQDCTVSTMSHESDLAMPLRDSDLGVHDSDSLDPDSSRTRSDTPPTRTPHRLVISLLLKLLHLLLHPLLQEQGNGEDTRCLNSRQAVDLHGHGHGGRVAQARSKQRQQGRSSQQ